MPNTTPQLNIEKYVIEKFLQKKYHQPFTKQKLPMTWKTGGVFETDAVSQDDTIAALISTSTPRTSGCNLSHDRSVLTSGHRLQPFS